MDSKLKSTRAGHRGAVTKLLTKFEDLKQESNTKLDQIKLLHNAMTEKQKVLSELNEKIVENISEEDVETEIIETDEYMFDFACSLQEITKFLQSRQTNNTPNIPVCSENCNNVSMHAAARPQPSYPHSHPVPARQMSSDPVDNSYRDIQYPNYHRLPKLDLPHFDGDVLQWSTFWDSYESTIHLNHTLTAVQKFSYLKAQLQGSAAQTIAGFALTNANYDTAVSLLYERYGQPHKIRQAYMQALLHISPPQNNLESIRSFMTPLKLMLEDLKR